MLALFFCPLSWYLISFISYQQIFWRVDGTKGTLQVERGNESGRHGYLVYRQLCTYFANLINPSVNDLPLMKYWGATLQLVLYSIIFFQVSFYPADGECQKKFYPFSGVTEELKSFIHDISQSVNKVFMFIKAYRFLW